MTDDDLLLAAEKNHEKMLLLQLPDYDYSLDYSKY